jgi:hypothetical protein
MRRTTGNLTSEGEFIHRQVPQTLQELGYTPATVPLLFLLIEVRAPADRATTKEKQFRECRAVAAVSDGIPNKIRPAERKLFQLLEEERSPQP